MIAPEPDGRPNFHEIHSRMAWNLRHPAQERPGSAHAAGDRAQGETWELVKPADGIIQYSQHVEAAAPRSMRRQRRWASRALFRSVGVFIWHDEPPNRKTLVRDPQDDPAADLADQAIKAAGKRASA
jgi:hypothetical protein